MSDLKEKSIKVLDDFMALNLSHQEITDKLTDLELRNTMIMHLKTELDTVMLFCNDTIGRVAVNKLCRKHGILNNDGGLPKAHKHG